jgi:hypothetical protein
MTETELFRQEGEEFRSVRLRVNADGSAHIDAQDMGPIRRESLGRR